MTDMICQGVKRGEDMENVDTVSDLCHIPCLSKLSSRRMQTTARYLLTSLRYKMVALLSLMMDDD